MSESEWKSRYEELRAGIEALDKRLLDMRDRADSWGTYRDKRPPAWMTQGPSAFEEAARRVRALLAANEAPSRAQDAPAHVTADVDKPEGTNEAQGGLHRVEHVGSCLVTIAVRSQWRNRNHWHAVWPNGQHWCYETEQEARARVDELNGWMLRP